MRKTRGCLSSVRLLDVLGHGHPVVRWKRAGMKNLQRPDLYLETTDEQHGCRTYQPFASSNKRRFDLFLYSNNTCKKVFDIFVFRSLLFIYSKLWSQAVEP